MNIINSGIVGNQWDTFWESEAVPLVGKPKPVLILSTQFSDASREAEQLNAIINGGCKLNAESYNLKMIPAGQKVAWHMLKQTYQPKVVLLFDIYPAQLGVSALFRLNDINNFDKAIWVPTISLAQLADNKEVKSAFWNNALKLIFVNKQFGEIV